MPEAYSKLCQISTMMRHIENPGIVRAVYSGMFSLFRHIQALLRHTDPPLDRYRILCNPCIYNRAIFRTLAHLEPEASPKA